MDCVYVPKRAGSFLELLSLTKGSWNCMTPFLFLSYWSLNLWRKFQNLKSILHLFRILFRFPNSLRSDERGEGDLNLPSQVKSRGSRDGRLFRHIIFNFIFPPSRWPHILSLLVVSKEPKSCMSELRTGCGENNIFNYCLYHGSNSLHTSSNV